MSSAESLKMSEIPSANTAEEQELIEEVKKLDPEEQKELKQHLKVEMTEFRGPIPSPEILRKFEDVCPGAADRIIKMAENQSSHRQNMEKKVIISNVWDSKLGLIFAFVICLVGILGGFYLITIDKGAVGLTTIAGFIGTLVWAFIYGSKSERKERAEKDKELNS